MKKIFVIFLMAMACQFAQAQNPYNWSFRAIKTSKGVYELHLTISMEAGWHIYSQTTPVGGPLATSISFSQNPKVSFEEEIMEIGNLQQKLEPMFGVEVKQYSNTVDFVQEVKKKGKGKTTLNGTVVFMLCDGRQCLPPTEVKFSMTFK